MPDTTKVTQTHVHTEGDGGGGRGGASKSFLGQQLGPFPIGVWILIVGAGVAAAFLIQRFTGASPAGASATDSAAGSNTGTSGAALGNGGGSTGGAFGGGGGGTGGGGYSPPVVNCPPGYTWDSQIQACVPAGQPTAPPNDGSGPGPAGPPQPAPTGLDGAGNIHGTGVVTTGMGNKVGGRPNLFGGAGGLPKPARGANPGPGPKGPPNPGGGGGTGPKGPPGPYGPPPSGTGPKGPPGPPIPPPGPPGPPGPPIPPPDGPPGPPEPTYQTTAGLADRSGNIWLST